MSQKAKKPTRRADGRYRKIVNGITFYAYSERELNRKILDFQEAKENGPYFKEVADEWWNDAYDTLAAQSIKVYKPALARAIDEFGNRRIKSIQPRDISLFLKILARQQLAQKTISNQKTVLKQIFDLAVVNGDIIYNPCASVKLPKNLNHTTREPATESEENIILTSNHPWLFPLFSLLSGLRKGEILALQWKDLYFDKKIISVTKSVEYISNRPKIKLPKTAAGIRIVPLVDVLAEKLLPFRAADDLYIFSDDGGKTPLTNKRYHTLYQKYCNDVGISATSHQIRHSYATIAVEQGVEIKGLQNAMGHTSVNLTLDIYAKARKHALDDMTNKLNEHYNSIHKR